ncbi:MAG: hypothetical protein GKR87_02260 [Kiritimatiellae bacterium]|nr:hypothetical protein [Kiritimatiellia bacterium]
MQTKNVICILGIMLAGISIISFSPTAYAIEWDQVHISGYGNAHAMDHSGLPKLVGKDDLDDLFFQLREFSLFFDLEVAEGIIASLEMEAGDNASIFTPNYAYVDFDLPLLHEAWNEDLLGGLSLRVGKFLVPFLSYNENKPNFKQHLMSQPFTAWQIVPVIPSPPDFEGLGWTDVGGMINWNRLLGSFGVLDVKYSIINGIRSDSEVLDDNTVVLDAGTVTSTIRPRDGLIQNESDDTRDNNNNKAQVVKISFASSHVPLNVGGSWYSGDWDPDSKHNLQMWGIHANWISKYWTLKGEWVLGDVEQEAGINPVTAPGPGPLNTSTGDYNMDAWYVEGSVVPFWWGKDDDCSLRFIVRYDQVNTNDKAAFTPFDRNRITYGTEWQFNSNARLRYEFQRSKIDNFESAPAPFKAAGGEEKINMNMLSVIFWF